MTANLNVKSLWSHEVPLCVLCEACGHRAAIEHDKLAYKARDVDTMTPLSYLPDRLRCTACKIKGQCRVIVPLHRLESDAFMGGINIEGLVAWGPGRRQI